MSSGVLNMRNRITLGLFLVTAMILAGCTSSDENPDWQPREEYPAWAYDAPFYYQPAEELQPQEKVGNNIPIYYVREKLVFVRHPNLPADWRTSPPASYGKRKLPKGKNKAAFMKNLWKQALSPYIEVWFSQDAGQHWKRAGYFGQEQSHFLFDSGGDGTFWVRFVGAGQSPAEVPPGQPHEIFVIDTHAPNIEVSVSPSPWEDDEKTIPHIYQIGETVTVSWSVTDMCLASDSVKLSTAFARFPHNLVWSEYEKSLPAFSSMKVKIPAEASHQSGLRFRIIAKDRAGNIGLGMSEIMHVRNSRISDPAEEKSPAVEAPEADGEVEYQPDSTEPEPKPEASSQAPREPRGYFSVSDPDPIALEKKKRTITAEPIPVKSQPVSKAAAKTATPKAPVRKQPAAVKPSQEMVLLESVLKNDLVSCPSSACRANKANLVPPAGLLDPILAKAKTPATKTTPASPPKKLAAVEPRVNFRSVAAVERSRSRSLESLKSLRKKKESQSAQTSVFDDAEKLFAPAEPVKPIPAAVKVKKIAASPAPKPVEPIAIEKLSQIPKAEADLTTRSEIATKPKSKDKSPPQATSAILAEAQEPVFDREKIETPAQPGASDLSKIFPPAPTPPAAGGSSPQAPKPASSRFKALARASETGPPSPKTIRRNSSSQPDLSNIPENIQLGWPAKGMTLRSGVSRLLSWMPQAAVRYQSIELQFSSNDSRKWITVAKGIKPGRALTWTVPVVNSKVCRLRLIGLGSKGDKAILATSEVFLVDTGVWETIDMSGFRFVAENDKKRS